MSTAAGDFFNWADNSQPNNAGVGAARPGTRAQTAAPRTRIGTAQSGGIPPRAQSRAQSRMGAAGGAVGGPRPPSVVARPVTQQGLAGVRSQSRAGVNRQVQDKSYYMGMLRAKINDLNREIDTLNKELERGNHDRDNFLIYEKRAEEAAMEIKSMQGKLADFNLLVDRMNTNSDLNAIQNDVAHLKDQNDMIAHEVDALFADRREKEEQIKQLEAELDSEKRRNQNLLNKLDQDARDRYSELKEMAEQVMEDARLKQQELEQLIQKKSDLEDELAVSPLKQEAMVLHERLAELQAKKEAIIEEINAEGTPEQQRERLLEKVKKDNEEIAAMQRQTDEIREKIEQYHEELRELDDEYEDQAGEKNEKYRELRQKEKQIDDFLDSFDINKAEEQERVERLHANVVKLLGHISRNWAQLDKTAVISGMDEYDLGGIGHGKMTEAKTAPELQEVHVRLQEELLKMDDMEEKAREELESLKIKIAEMDDEMGVFNDLDTLKESVEQKREGLQAERSRLETTVVEAREALKKLQAESTAIKAKLNENDAYQQVVNAEKKLQYVEQNNYALRETVEARSAETNVGPVKEQVLEMIANYNTTLVTLAATRVGSATRVAMANSPQQPY
uniref:Uncharacterized protein n=1 Tax=Plectus sambesii TaxID=2011161 RepID=A0A914W2R0_9BILA